jgi:MFS transporter
VPAAAAPHPGRTRSTGHGNRRRCRLLAEARRAARRADRAACSARRGCARRVLGLGPHVQHQDPPIIHAPDQLISRDRLQRRHVAQVAARGLPGIREPRRREVLHLAHERADVLVSQPVINPHPVAAGSDQPRAGQRAQLRRGVGHLAVITAGISHALAAGLSGAFLLGAGTSLVYPTLLAAISDATHPDWRAPALGVYRFWRDCGYAVGALIGGITATLASLDTAIAVAAVLTAISGLLAWVFMHETHPPPGRRRRPNVTRNPEFALGTGLAVWGCANLAAGGPLHQPG